MIEVLGVTPQILAGMASGMVIGINRSRQHKATGVRTLGLVGLGAAAITAAAAQLGTLGADPASISRVMQGVLTGIGFLGAGVVLHGPREHQVHGLTTAAAIWLVAIIGVICGAGEWPLAALCTGLAFILLAAGERMEDMVRGTKTPPASTRTNRSGT